MVLLGDSFTLGSWNRIPVGDDEVYSAVLEDLIPGTTVVNLGVDGYGVDQMFLRLREHGFAYQPDLVILAVYADDFARSLLSFRDHPKPRFKLHGDQLVLTGVPIAPVNEFEREGDVRPAPWLWVLARRHFITPSFVLERTAELNSLPGDVVNLAILDAITHEVHEYGANLLVMSIPYGLDGDPHRTEKLLRNWVDSSRVPFVDIRTQFLALPHKKQEGLYAGHWTPAGHRAAAEALRATIERGALLERQTRHNAVGTSMR